MNSASVGVYDVIPTGTVRTKRWLWKLSRENTRKNVSFSWLALGSPLAVHWKVGGTPPPKSPPSAGAVVSGAILLSTNSLATSRVTGLRGPKRLPSEDQNRSTRLHGLHGRNEVIALNKPCAFTPAKVSVTVPSVSWTESKRSQKTARTEFSEPKPSLRAGLSGLMTRGVRPDHCPG